MYTDDLQEKSIPFDDIVLDPNNPRFFTEKSTGDVPDAKVADERVQQRAWASIEGLGIQELYHSILRNGFLPLDRIVVRALPNGKYVVVEGNRRLAALKLLRSRIEEGTIDEEHIDHEYLTNLYTATEELIVLVYDGDIGQDISWILQGVRHISGIRPWQPAQRARLVADQIESKGMSFSEAGQKFGLSAQAVGRLYRAYKALEQMRQDDDFQGKALNEYFSLFEEAIRNRQTKDWLGWRDDLTQFENTGNLKQFYSWIVPDDDYDNARRIHDPKQIKKLGALVGDESNRVLLDRVDDHEVSLDWAYDSVINKPTEYDWRSAVQKAIQLVGQIPQASIAKNSPALLAMLGELESSIHGLKEMASAVSASDETDS